MSDPGALALPDLDTRERWRRGYIAPWRITTALDQGGFEGPDVDIACGAVEPAVDRWEAGTEYPSYEQLHLLAKLTGRPPAWFVQDGEPLDIRTTSLWAHMRQRERDRWKPPVLRCTAAAIESCPGTAAYDEVHLF